MRQSLGNAIVETDDSIRPVAPPSPQAIFETTADILGECVRVLGERLESLVDKAMPETVTVEFSLTFKVSGRASIIPVFITGESAAETGIKVTAKWALSDNPEVASHDDSSS